MTRICALLSFFDESPLWLTATVASLAGVADRVVAVDGSYALYPQARASSPVEQHQALVETAAAARIPLTLHIPSEPWDGNEVEKRNATVQIARAAGCTEGWWLLVVDADMVVTRVSEIHLALEEVDTDVCLVGVTHRDDPHANPVTERVARDGLWQTTSTQPYRLLYRSDPSLRYEGAHYIVRNDRGFLWGNESTQTLLPAHDLTMELEFDHRSRLRDLERRTQQKAYYRVRDSLSAETLAVAL